MKLTIEELRKVYDAGSTGCPLAEISAMHDAAILALARFVAERQRAVEPTEEMEIEAVKSGCNKIDAYCAYRAMSAVAPLVVPDVPTVRGE